MDKSQLRSVLSTLTAGQEVDVRFVRSSDNESGTYTVARVRRGRGKGGSLLADLVNGQLSEAQCVTIGTPTSEMVVSISVNGELHGSTDESSMPVVGYDTNAARAAELKTQFKTLLGHVDEDTLISIESSKVSALDGDFSFVSAKQLRGRGGQVVLTLKNSFTDEEVEIWSGRHSGVIDSFVIGH